MSNSLSWNTISIDAVDPIGNCLLYVLLTAVLCIYNYMFPLSSLMRVFNYELENKNLFLGFDIVMTKFIILNPVIGLGIFFVGALWLFKNEITTLGVNFTNENIWYITTAAIFYFALFCQFIMYCIDYAYSPVNLEVKGGKGLTPYIRQTGKDRASRCRSWSAWLSTYFSLMGFILFTTGLGYYQSNNNLQNNPTHAWFSTNGALPALSFVGGLILAASLLLYLVRFSKTRTALDVSYSSGRRITSRTRTTEDDKTWDAFELSHLSTANYLFSAAEGPKDQDEIALIRGWIPVVHLPNNWLIAYLSFLFVASLDNGYDLIHAVAYFAAVGMLPLVLAMGGQSLDYFFAYHVTAQVAYIICNFWGAVIQSQANLSCTGSFCVGQQLNWAVALSGAANSSDLNSLVDPFTVNFFTGLFFALAVLSCSITAFGTKMVDDSTLFGVGTKVEVKTPLLQSGVSTSSSSTR